MDRTIIFFTAGICLILVAVSLIFLWLIGPWFTLIISLVLGLVFNWLEWRKRR